MTRRARLYSLIGMIWVGGNFLFMVGNAMRNGTSAFPGGVHDASGYYSIDHGRRYDFTELGFKISYWQSLITCASFPLFLLGTFILHAKGEMGIKNRQS